MGVVSISRYNSNLEDDANRNGLQDGPGLVQLKEILLAVIDEFERDHQYVGRKLDQYYKEQSRTQAELEELERLAEQRKRWEKEQAHESHETKAENSAPPSIAAPVANPIRVQQLFRDVMEEKDQEIIDYKMASTIGFNGSALISYINDEIPDMTCFILTSYGMLEKLSDIALQSDFEQKLDKLFQLGNMILQKE